MQNEPRIVFFIGKPGSGKGTQAKILAEKTNWPIIGSGALLRDIAKEESRVGRKIKEEIEQGLLVPHWLAMYLYLKTLFSMPENESAIFDGFNRKEDEARLIVSSMQWLNRPFSVVHIRVSNDEVRKRLEGRVHNSGRADDHYVDTRLEEYETYTIKALEIFSDMGHLIDINGEQEPHDVARDVIETLGISVKA